MAVIATFYDHILDMTKQLNISIEEALQEAKALGVTQMEVSVNNAQGQGRELGERLAAAGMGISTMPSFFDFGRNPDVEAQARPVFDLAKELGADRLLVIAGFTEGAPEQVEAQTRAMAEVVARLGELADKAGLGLTMEDFDNERAPFSTSAGMLRFLNACPQMTACFDTGNFRFMGEDALSAYQALRGKIGHVHLKDRAGTPAFGDQAIRAVDGVDLYPCPVGAGMIPMAELVERLKEDGYQGTYTIEHYGAGDMLACLKASVAWLKKQGI